jgi:hypothetical protein
MQEIITRRNIVAKMRDELNYCGLDCEGCDIHRSTVLGEALSPGTFKRWQDDFKNFWHIELTSPEQLKCRGCRSNEEDEFFGFKLCPIRNCCIKRGLSSCGICPEFKTCKQHDIKEGRENLERIAAME